MLHFTNSRSSGRKLALVLLVICSITSLYSQQFHSLDGLEGPTGQTILLYRLGSEEFYQFNPIFKFNTVSNFEMKIMDAYAIEYPTSADVKSVSDFEFFQNDTVNFLNTGFRVIMDLNGYSAINDSFKFFHFGSIEIVEISRQDPQKVFISDLSTTFRSFDGGYTFPEDSNLYNANFTFLSISDFNDNIWFGLNEESKLVKSDAGIVDTSNIIYDRYLNFYYDINQFHIYRVNRTYGEYSLNVSNNKGNAFTWTKTYQSENPIYVTIDSTQSGVLYLADGRKIYRSVNNGYSFSEYKSLPSKLVGIYKKPNSEILYAASKSKIYKITPDATVVIKSMPVSPEVFNYYPLAIGNYWIYKVTDWSYPYYSEDTFTRRVVSKEILSNNKEYFKIEEKYLNSAYTNYLYERIDSAKGLVYRFDNECQNPDSEKVIDDFTAEVGDSLLIQRFTMFWDSILTYFSELGSESIFNEDRNFRTYEYSWLMSYNHKLAQGIGIYNIRNGYDFGESYFF
ncbi:MAG: hypothetical protein IPI19_05285 [Ignavibacteriales bacterium]|nr:hypothetical protein [Ignavibacteriales bacterium]